MFWGNDSNDARASSFVPFIRLFLTNMLRIRQISSDLYRSLPQVLDLNLLLDWLGSALHAPQKVKCFFIFSGPTEAAKYTESSTASNTNLVSRALRRRHPASPCWCLDDERLLVVPNVAFTIISQTLYRFCHTVWFGKVYSWFASKDVRLAYSSHHPDTWRTRQTAATCRKWPGLSQMMFFSFYQLRGTSCSQRRHFGAQFSSLLDDGLHRNPQ